MVLVLQGPCLDKILSSKSNLNRKRISKVT